MGDERLVWLKKNVFGQKIVDIGCNEGLTFRDHPLVSRITGVDIDAWNPPGYAKFVQSDAATLPFAKEEFDCAVVSEILEHVPDPVAVLKEARRVAKVIMFTIPNEYNWHPAALPMVPLADRLKLENLTYDQKMIVEARKQFCSGIVDDKTKPHLWHIRFFDLDMVCEVFEKAGLKYRIEALEYDKRPENVDIPVGWSFFVGWAK
jgi:SAM-dependent methyltransferase